MESSEPQPEEYNQSSMYDMNKETSGSTQYLREVNCSKVPELTRVVKINSHKVTMKVDTGAGVSIVGEGTWNQIAPKAYTLLPSP